MKPELTERIVSHLLEISVGKCTITQEMILSESSSSTRDILGGLLCLFEDIDYKTRKISQYQITAEARLKELLAVLDALSRLDYSKRAEIGSKSDVFNKLASRMNVLGKELEASTVSANFLDNIVQSMSECLVVTDPGGRITMVNRSTLETLGYSEGELLGKPIGILVEKKLQASSLLTDSQRRRVDYVAKDGNLIPLLLSCTIMKDGTHGSAGVVYAATDIRSRMVAENRLKESETKYRTLIDNMNEGVIVVDNRDIIGFVNRRLCELMGYSESELIGKVANEVLLPEKNRKGLKSNIVKRRQGVSGTYEMQVRTKSGELTWMLISGAPIYDSVGTIIGSIGIQMDINKSKQAEIALQESELRLKTLTQCAYDAIITVDDNGNIVMWNQGAERTFGYKGDEIIGSPFCTVLQKKNHASNAEIVRGFMTSKNGRNDLTPVELVGHGKSGNTFPIELTANTWETSEGAFLTCIVRDIADRKRVQEQIIAAIVDAQEIERQRFSKDLHDGLGQIMAAAQMNLNALITEMEMDGSLDEEKKALGSVTLTILGSAIRDLRNISHNLMPQTLHDFGLRAAFKALVDMVNQSGRLKIEFRSDLAADRYERSIEMGIYRVAQELLNNTIKHAKAQWIKLALNKGSGELHFTYQDNGIGFNTDDNHVPRSGLGLHNIETRVRSIDGQLTMRSSPGNGIKVEIIAPAVAI